jgi:hypothetical protein
VIKVFEDFNFSRVGQMQSLLDSQGIKTFLKNEFGSSVVGELPFVEVIPQLYILEEKDLALAMELLRLEQPAAGVEKNGVEKNRAEENWICPKCRADVEGNFSRCWCCGAQHP